MDQYGSLVLSEKFFKSPNDSRTSINHHFSPMMAVCPYVSLIRRFHLSDKLGISRLDLRGSRSLFCHHPRTGMIKSEWMIRIFSTIFKFVEPGIAAVAVTIGNSVRSCQDRER